MKQRLGESLPPWPRLLQSCRRLQRALFRHQSTIDLHHLLQQITLHRCGNQLLKRGLEAVKLCFRNRQPRRHRMTTKFQDQTCLLLAEQIQQVTDMHAWNRTGRPLELTILPLGKDDGGTVQLLLDTPGDDTDHPLMPMGLIECYRSGRLCLLQME